MQRFPTARSLMVYLGLVPGEHSSGDRHRRGSITKTGSALARQVIALADKAQQRLCRRFRRLAEHKPSQVVAVAVGRELVGFMWAALHPETA